MALASDLITHLQDLDIDVEALAVAHLLPAHTAVRRNVHKPSAAFSAECATVPWCADGLYLSSKPSFILDPLWHAGAYYVQEASSMFLHQALLQHANFASSLRVIDLCAAPGGKSTLVANLMSKESLMICNEVIGSRIAPLAENLVKWGLDNTWVSNSDPKHIGRLSHFADIMLVDAPCSGSGLMRKDEKYAQEWSDANVQLCCERQQRILHDAWPALKPGGLLIYMTCSFSKGENEDIADSIARDLGADSLKIACDDAWGVVHTHSTVQHCHGYRFYPHLLQGEGFYLAAFRKKEGPINQVSAVSMVPKHHHKVQADHLIDTSNHDLWIDVKQNVIATQKAHAADFSQLSNTIRIVRRGLLVGTNTKNKLVPSHDLALSTLCTKNFPSVELTHNQALHYLSKQDMQLELPVKGWYIVTHQSLNLGFINYLGNRLNNYFPTHLRIRKAIS
jgi:16S rRNA C967 or C1407 C5-methylase (RsmB/RsmF family)/NOL1/NOP2/fmu family ribosome biogenesis protein